MRLSKGKIPIRKCVACNESKPKKELLRIVNNKELGVLVDTTGKVNGRGAYICKDLSCFDKLKKTRRLNNALGTEITEEIYEEIKRYVSED